MCYGKTGPEQDHKLKTWLRHSVCHCSGQTIVRKSSFICDKGQTSSVDKYQTDCPTNTCSQKRCAEQEEMLPGGILSVCVTVGQLVEPGSAMQAGYAARKSRSVCLTSPHLHNSVPSSSNLSREKWAPVRLSSCTISLCLHEWLRRHTHRHTLLLCTRDTQQTSCSGDDICQVSVTDSKLSFWPHHVRTCLCPPHQAAHIKANGSENNS